MKILFLFFMLQLSACGDSPLFNHTMEGGKLANDFFETQADGYELKNSGYRFHLDWVSGPSMGESKFILKSWHPDLGTISGPYQDLPNQLHVYLWMSSMGHGSSPVKIKKLSTGEYEVSSVYFIMGGTWEVHVELLKQDDVVDEVSITIPL